MELPLLVSITNLHEAATLIHHTTAGELPYLRRAVNIRCGIEAGVIGINAIIAPTAISVRCPEISCRIHIGIPVAITTTRQHVEAYCICILVGRWPACGTAQLILRLYLAAYCIKQFIPFCLRGYVRVLGTDTLHTTGV